MKLIFSLVVLTFVVLEASGYPYPVFTSSANVDTWSYGDANHGGRVLSRSYGPYANRRIVRGGPTTYSVYQPETRLTSQQAFEYHQAVKRRQALLEVNDTPPQENEPLYPQVQDPAVVPVEATELILPNDPAQVIPTTEKAIVPELVEPEIEENEEPVQQSKKVAEEKKQTKWLFDEEDDDDEEDYPSQAKFLRGGSFFPMIFGWSGAGSGPIAIANAYSTGKGGAAASHATAYANQKPVERKP
uniref:Uncharacterized protein n=1 Tax=Heliothis virescens TaxID=7102 RepID=A0A2A4JHU5_HELVI